MYHLCLKRLEQKVSFPQRVKGSAYRVHGYDNGNKSNSCIVFSYQPSQCVLAFGNINAYHLMLFTVPFLFWMSTAGNPNIE